LSLFKNIIFIQLCECFLHCFTRGTYRGYSPDWWSGSLCKYHGNFYNKTIFFGKGIFIFDKIIFLIIINILDFWVTKNQATFYVRREEWQRWKVKQMDSAWKKRWKALSGGKFRHRLIREGLTNLTILRRCSTQGRVTCARKFPRTKRMSLSWRGFWTLQKLGNTMFLPTTMARKEKLFFAPVWFFSSRIPVFGKDSS